jgi:hypothetical protein
VAGRAGEDDGRGERERMMCEGRWREREEHEGEETGKERGIERQGIEKCLDA